MSSNPEPSGDAALSQSAWRRIEHACDAWEAIWRKGRCPRIEDALTTMPDLERAVLLREMIVREVSYRRGLGEAPEPGDYLERFPGDAATIAAAFDEFTPVLGCERDGGPRGEIDPSRERTMTWVTLHKVRKTLTGVSFSVGELPAETGPSGKMATRPMLGDYEILEELGAGGMGVVYRARQMSANRIVALKFIRPDQLGGMTAEQRRVWIERFRTEARATARIEHPNVVIVYEVGLLGDCPYYSMRYIGGESLAVMLRDGPVSNERAAAYLEPVARAVHAAHEHGIVHRDLKPHNILVDGADQPFVADFGLAKWLDATADMTHTGEWIGTPSYMSPEQARDATHVTPSSDVYSLGGTLYALLTGRPPFAAAQVAEVLYQVKHHDPVPPRALNPTVHRDLETIALKCLSKEPGRRYASARDLADDLGRFRHGEPIHARRVAAWERAWLWARRRPALAGLIVASVIALFASLAASAALMAYRFSDQARREAEQAKQTIEQMNQTLDQVLYVNRLQRAYRHWQDHDIDPARALLDECPEALRHWEWHYLQRLCAADQLTLKRQASPARESGVTSVACSADGKLLAAGRKDKTITLWDMATGTEVRTLTVDKGPYSGPVRYIVFSPDGKRLASNSSDLTIKLWDVETGAMVRTLKGHEGVGNVEGLAFSPDGTQLASVGRDDTVRLWEPLTGKEIRTYKYRRTPFYPGDGLFGVAFSPDGTRLAVGGTRNVSGKKIEEDGVVTPRVADGHDGVARYGVTLWDMASGKPSLSFGDFEHPSLNLAFSPDGRRLAAIGTGSDKASAVRIWDSSTGKRHVGMRGRGPAMGGRCVAFSPDGKRLASTDGDLIIWDAETGQELRAINHLGPSPWVLRSTGDPYRMSQDCVTFVPDTGGFVAGGYQEKPLTEGSYSGETEEGFLVIHELTGGRESLTLRGHVGRVNGVAFAPSGRYLASAGGDETVRVWEVASGKTLQTLAGHAKSVTAVAYSPDGTILASASDWEVRVWDPATGKLLRVLHGGYPRPFLTFAPDGRLASARLNEVVSWDPRNGEQLGITRYPHPRDSGSWMSIPDGLALSPDHRWIAMCNGPFGFWLTDATAAGKVAFHWDETGAVNRLAFSPDGRRLATVGANVTLVWNTGAETHMSDAEAYQIMALYAAPDLFHLWESDRDPRIPRKDSRTTTAGRDGTKLSATRSGLRSHYRRKILCAIKTTSEPTSLAFTPDSRRLVTGGADKAITIWDADNGRQLFSLARQADAVTDVAFSPDGQVLATAGADGTIKLWSGIR